MDSDVSLSMIPQGELHRALAWERIMKEFDTLSNRKYAVEEYAAKIGKSAGRFYGFFYAWKKHGLKALLKKTTLRKLQPKRPAEFTEWFRGLLQEINTDSVPAGRRRMMERWAGGEKIPGLGTWRDGWAKRFPELEFPSDGPVWPRTVDDLECLLPPGYGARSLLRDKQEKYDLVASRQGTFAAKRYGPQVFTTRVGLKAGQVLMCDDVWHNVKCNWLGSSKALRPIELCMMDALTGHKVAWGMRPRIWNDETRSHEIIKEHEFRYLLAYAFCESVGYRPDGTILWLERGTAAVDEDLERIFSNLSGGCISVKRAPLKEGRQLCSLYRAVGGGNPNFKAPLEAHHSIGHTEISHVVGQIGRHRDLQPEGVYGLDKENNVLLQLASVLPPELAQLLCYPVLNWTEYQECVSTAYDTLAWRHWHKLEGWEECKFFRKEFWLEKAAQWIPMSSLQDVAPDQADKILEALSANTDLVRDRRLSPIEAWQKTSQGMLKLPKEGVPLILGPKNGIVRKCPQEQYLVFSSREHGPTPHRYARDYRDREGYQHRLEPGREYLFHINPFSPERELFISDPDCRYLGVSPRINVPCRADTDAVMAEIKRKQTEKAEAYARVDRRALGRMAREAVQMQRNAALVTAAVDAGLLPEVKHKPRQIEAGPTTSTAADDGDDAILELSGQ